MGGDADKKRVVTDPRSALGVRPVINVAGTMTSLGASIARPEVIDAVMGILPHFVEIDDLQRRASCAIADATGSEAGCVTACASAGISISIAGAMTGNNLSLIERLPDTSGLRNEVIVQTGHLCQYSAPIDQAVRLTGASVRAIGSVNEARPDQLAVALTDRAAAMLFVVSHQTSQHGQISLEQASEICRERAVPLVVDAAAEYDLRGFLARGAEIVVYSAHKFLGGMTAGIVAGRKDLVRAAYLQSAGIGRGMKAGKEGIVGTIAALEAWQRRDHAADREKHRRVLALWQKSVAGLAGIEATLVPDPTGNPIERLRLSFGRRRGARAADIVARLTEGDPPIFVRDEFLDLNMFELDPCNLHQGEAHIVGERLREVLSVPPGDHVDLADLKRKAHAKRITWPD